MQRAIKPDKKNLNLTIPPCNRSAALRRDTPITLNISLQFWKKLCCFTPQGSEAQENVLSAHLCPLPALHLRAFQELADEEAMCSTAGVPTSHLPCSRELPAAQTPRRAPQQQAPMWAQPYPWPEFSSKPNEHCTLSLKFLIVLKFLGFTFILFLKFELTATFRWR